MCAIPSKANNQAGRYPQSVVPTNPAPGSIQQVDFTPGSTSRYVPDGTKVAPTVPGDRNNYQSEVPYNPPAHGPTLRAREHRKNRGGPNSTFSAPSMNAKEGIPYRSISVPLQKSNEQGCSLLFFYDYDSARNGYSLPAHDHVGFDHFRERSRSSPVLCI